MSYYSSYSGVIDITNANPETTPIIDRFLHLVSDSIDENPEIHENGNTISITIYGGGKWYDWNDDLDLFVKELQAAGCTVDGDIERHGEEDDDMENWECANGQTRTQLARIIYADDAEILTVIKEAYGNGPEAILKALKNKNLY